MIIIISVSNFHNLFKNCSTSTIHLKCLFIKETMRNKSSQIKTVWNHVLNYNFVKISYKMWLQQESVNWINPFVGWVRKIKKDVLSKLIFELSTLVFYRIPPTQ